MSPLSFTEISSFFGLIEYKPQPWELELIELFDNIALEEMQKTK